MRLLKSHDNSTLFINRSGNPLGIQGIRDAVKAHAATCGLEWLPINPHVLRKTACTDLYLASGDIEMVRRFARHVKTQTTQIYVNAPEHRLTEAVDRYHPLSAKDAMRLAPLRTEHIRTSSN